MTQFSTGDLEKLYYVDESTYATTPTGALSWGGEIISLKPLTNMNKQFHYGGGSRWYQSTTRGPYKMGYTVRARSRIVSGAFDWTDFWAYYGFGGATALARHLDSFTTQSLKSKGGVDYYTFFNGCKFNRFAIVYERIGHPIVFEGDVFSQFVTQDVDKNITGLQALTVGADPADITTSILTWNAASQINIAGGGLANWYPQKISLTTLHNLVPLEGHRVGADSVKYPVALQLNEGPGELILEAELKYEDETYTAAKLADSAITAVTLPAGAKTITLSGGELVEDDFPEESHAPMIEPVRIRFNTVAIA